MLDIAKAYPISTILEEVGCVRGRCGGGKIFYSSPFSSDSDPSLCVYVNSNTFHDFSNGMGGDSIDLYMKLKDVPFAQAIRDLSTEVSLDDLEQFIKSEKEKGDKPFFYESYVTKEEDHVKKIKEYAESRKIVEGYLPSKVPDYSTGERVDKLAMMFLHQNEEGVITGAKFRFISPSEGGSRFTARGKLNMYIRENLINNSDPVLYIAESETSGNSLWEVMKSLEINGVVISMGGVSKRIENFPEEFSNIKNRYLIIDFDGDEEKYNERIRFHGDIAKPLKIELSKGEDLNSLYCEGRIDEIKNLLFKLV